MKKVLLFIACTLSLIAAEPTENTFKINGALLSKTERTYSFLTSDKNFLPFENLSKCVFTASFEFNENNFQSRLETFLCVTTNSETIEGTLIGTSKGIIPFKDLSKEEILDIENIYGIKYSNDINKFISQDTEITYSIKEIKSK